MISELYRTPILLLVLACTVILAAGIADASSEGDHVPTQNIPSSDHPPDLFITINPIGNHTVGEVFFINGTTNLPVSEYLVIEVFLAEYPSQLKTGGVFSGIPVTCVPITAGMNGSNTWSINATMGNWMPKEYVAEVLSPDHPSVIPEYQVFLLFIADINTPPTVLQTPIQQQQSSPTYSSVTVSQTRHVAPPSLVPAIVVLAGLVMMRSLLWSA